MGDNTVNHAANAALQATLDSLVASIRTLQTSVEANAQAIQLLDAALPPPCGSSHSAHSGSGEHHQDRPPRFQKLDFPRYNGKSDPLIFINRCESYFHQQRIMEEEKVWMASYNLEDGAQLWYYQVQQDKGTPSWCQFTELLHLRFGPPLRSNPLGELAACHRTGTVADYQDRFQALLPRAGRLDEAQRVQLFTAGLLPPLSHDVEIHNPQSLVAAMSLARKIDLRNSYVAPAARVPPRDRPLLQAPAPRLALPAPSADKADKAAPATITVEGRPVRRLTQAEQEERRRLGLYYNYDEKFGPGTIGSANDCSSSTASSRTTPTTGPLLLKTPPWRRPRTSPSTRSLGCPSATPCRSRWPWAPPSSPRSSTRDPRTTS
ncbi:uncharacterized protein [Miscanthus floridulus]|uniref:uncharacterized protein n=1 Tax=Miscanthus floridulus TaxID=154761 RepID=UPI0034588EA6